MNSPSSKLRKIRVLAVDDDPIQREFYQARLSSKFDVTTAASPMVALAMLAKAEFDIVVTDFDMPGMSGLDLLSKLRADARTLDLPVIFVTGSEELAVVNSAYKLGIATFASKPVNWTVLIAQIEQSAAALP